jgi:epoxyqueuosine reductase
MKPDEAVEDLRRNLGKAGFLVSIISVTHLAELDAEIADLLAEGWLDRDFHDKSLAPYTFRPPSDLPRAKSIILTATRQPRIRIGFRLSGRPHSFVIPPTYDNSTDAKALGLVEATLGTYGYAAGDAILRWKALAVQSGLASYGRNNIAYVEGWGSLARFKGFYSDLPASDDTWRSPVVMERCSECAACLKACPSDAITDDRFVIHAERCITLFNEEIDEFPEWIDPGWHTCLVGCMICQDVCPVNRPHAAYEVKSIDFSEAETLMLLDGPPRDRLPSSTLGKLEKSTLIAEYEILPRNLGVLLQRGS